MTTSNSYLRTYLRTYLLTYVLTYLRTYLLTEPGRARRGSARAQGAGAAVRGAERRVAPGREGAEHPAPEELTWEVGVDRMQN